MSEAKKKLKIPLKQQLTMWAPYCWSRLWEQIKSVLPVLCLLIFFQVAILRVGVMDAGIIAIGMSLVVIGLAFFLEGLLIGIMALGEIIGIKMPVKAGLAVILIVGFALGVGATFAEPSIGVLKASGAAIKPESAPLLYLLLNSYADRLVWCVGIGVGFAVLAGMLRFYYSLSLKPFIYIIIPMALAVSCVGFFMPNIMGIMGLAWDCGGVTTGPVTVPIVLALGIGISRSVGGEDNGAMGFGVVTLASALPIIVVIGYGIYLCMTGQVPDPAAFKDFVADPRAAFILGGADNLAEYIRTNGANAVAGGAAAAAGDFFSLEQIIQIISKNFLAACQAIIPLVVGLLLVFVIILREKLQQKDEIFFGIVIALIGMGCFNVGMEFGLTKMGNQVGANLPASFTTIERKEAEVDIPNFNPEVVQKAIDANGNVINYFYVVDRRTSDYIEVEYNEAAIENGTYKYIPKIGPLYGDTEKSIPGFAMVLLFAFVLGLFATLAEPALAALGMKVEELTVGTYKKKTLVWSVAVGVGLGLVLGAVKIIWDIKLLYMLLPAYIILLLLTIVSDELYTNVGWDSAGVTTGPITVPLVLAMGLGLGSQMGVAEGFGILSMASACPILTVLASGLWSKHKAKKLMREHAAKGGAA